MSDSKTPLKPDGSVRNFEIQRAVKLKEEKMVQDTIILQKVNKAKRESFKEKFPGQVEHCMRLTMERLQYMLSKKPTDLSDPDTWNCTASEIHDLAHGLYYLSIINQHYPIEGE